MTLLPRSTAEQPNVDTPTPPVAVPADPTRFYQLGPIMGGALNRQATRVGAPECARLTIAETQALRERAIDLLRSALQQQPAEGPSALAEPIAASLVEEAEQYKLARLKS